VTTKQIEQRLVKYITGYIMSLRIYIGHELDYMVMNMRRFIIEYEIKTSKPDFKNDFKKPKHKRMAKGFGGRIRRFYFVTPVGLIERRDIPKYAGWIEIPSRGKPITRKKAPLLKARKSTSKEVESIYRSMMFRFLRKN